MARRGRRFAPSETAIQVACLQHWLVLGVPGSLVCCIPNAGAMGQPGLTPGVADLLVLAPGLPVGFLELKKDEQAPVSDAQLEFGALCRRLGVPYALCIGRDAPIHQLEAWGAVRPQGEPMHHTAWQGSARQGPVWRGSARQGEARQGGAA